MREGANITTTLETTACIWFLSLITVDKSIITLIVEKPNLLEAVVKYASHCIPLDGNCDVILNVYYAIESVLAVSEALDRFVALGGLALLNKTLHVLVQCIENVKFEAGDLYSVIEVVLDASRACFHGFAARYDAGAGMRDKFPEELLQMLQRDRVLEFIALLYPICQREHRLATTAVPCWIHFTDCLRHCVKAGLAAAAVETVLMYQGGMDSGGTPQLPCIVNAVRLMRSGAVDVESAQHIICAKVLNRFWHAYPSVHAAIEADVGIVHQCAFRGCLCTSLLRHRLKHCTRCRAARYCGWEHQLLHWIDKHKRTCQRCEVAAGTETVDEAQAEETPPTIQWQCALPSCPFTSLHHRDLKNCARCLSVRYCCREHQVEHWKAEHKRACQL